jgi:3-methyladenine DNA glycosylase AlkC
VSAVPKHPSQRFRAPNTILAGVPLKDVFGAKLIRLIGESLTAVAPGFDQRRFRRSAIDGLEPLGFHERARHIGRALAAELPASFAEACPLLLASLGPELMTTEGNGLAPFFYHPHGWFIADRGLDDVKLGLQANYELTKRFTAEFSLRPFLVKDRDQCLRRMLEWTSDPNPHVRRLVSEGSRPRLPWGMRLKEFQQNPQWTLPLLEQLKDDPTLYVRRSVANHLGDLLKDHPDVIYETCDLWLREVRSRKTPTEVATARRWLIRHAVRLPAKQGKPRALELRAAAK